MILKYIKPNRLTLIIGAFLAFMIIAAPQTAKADDTCSNGDFYNSYGKTLTNMAGRLTAIHKDYLDNAVQVNTDMYCINTLIGVIEKLRAFTATIDLFHGIAYVAIGFLIDAFINAACAIAQQLLTDVSNIGHSLFVNICLPLPQLHIGLTIPGISHTCIGLGGQPLGMIGLQPMSAPPTTPKTPNYFNPWGAENANGDSGQHFGNATPSVPTSQ